MNADMRKYFLQPATIGVGLIVLLFITIALFAFSEDWSLAFAYFSVFLVFSTLILFMLIFEQSDNNSWLFTFLRVNHSEPLTFSRFNSCLGEIFLAVTIFSIAVGFSRYFDSQGAHKEKMVLAICVVTYVCFSIAFSIFTFLNQCFNHGQRVRIDVFKQVVMALFFITFTQKAIEFGRFSGEGIAEYYIKESICSNGNRLIVIDDESTCIKISQISTRTGESIEDPYSRLIKRLDSKEQPSPRVYSLSGEESGNNKTALYIIEVD